MTSPALLTLARPIEVHIPSAQAQVDAVDRIRRAIASEASVEVDPDVEPARVLRGEVNGFAVRLYLRLAGQWVRHGRSWSIELSGNVQAAASGSQLSAVIRIGWPWVWWFLWLWRGMVTVAVLVGIAATANLGKSVAVIAIGAVLLGLSVAVDRRGTRTARADAQALLEFLEAALR